MRSLNDVFDKVNHKIQNNLAKVYFSNFKFYSDLAHFTVVDTKSGTRQKMTSEKFSMFGVDNYKILEK